MQKTPKELDSFGVLETVFMFRLIPLKDPLPLRDKPDRLIHIMVMMMDSA